jgi:hypothetical protein
MLSQESLSGIAKPILIVAPPPPGAGAAPPPPGAGAGAGAGCCVQATSAKTRTNASVIANNLFILFHPFKNRFFAKNMQLQYITTYVTSKHPCSHL